MYGRALGPHETVGRQRELTEIDHALRRALAGHTTGLVIRGAAGIGKSRLFDHLMVGATELGVSTRLLRCTEEVEDLDFLWRQLVMDPDRRRPPIESRTSDTLGPDRLLTRRAHELSILIDAVVEAADQPLLIAVDDVHLATPLLVSLIEQLTQRLRQSPALPILVALSTRPTPDEASTTKAVANLISFSGCIELGIRPLSGAEEMELIRQEEPQATPTYVGVVRAASGGNPLRSRTAVTHLGRIGVPATVEAGDEAGRLRIELASGGGATIAAWLADLPPAVRLVLGVGAALDGGFRQSEVVQLLGDDEGDDGDGGLARTRIDEALDAAVELGVLVSDGFRHWFAHDLYREGVWELLPGPRRRELNRRRAAALLETTSLEDGPAWLTIGRHLLLAEGSTESVVDPIVHVRAGRAALEIGEWFEAAQLFRRALSSSGQAELTTVDRASTLYLCGVAHFFDHDLKGCVDVLSEAISLADSRDDPDLWASALRMRLWAINNLDAEAYRRPTDLTEYLGAVDRLDDPDLQAQLLHACAETFITAGRLDEGRAAADQAATLARDRANPSTQAVCTYAVGYADLTAGRVRTAYPALTEAVRLAGDADDWYVESSLVGRLAFAHLGVGELDRAQASAERSIQQAAVHSEHSGQALGGSVLSTVALLAGDVRLARARLQEARLATERSSYRGADLFLGPVEVVAALYECDHDAARLALDGWPALPGVLRRELDNLITAHEGSGSGRSPLPLPTWRENQVAIAALAIDLQAALIGGDRARLVQLDELVEPLRRGEVAYPSMAPLSTDRLLGELDLAMGRPADAAQRLGLAAERLRASGAAAERALTIFALARATAELDGPPDDARRLASEAAELLARLGLVWSHDAARAFAGSGVDARSLVERRGGSWTVILVTDVVSSTEVSARFGDVAYHDLIMAHHEIVREACCASGGHETGDSGDGLYYWFQDTGPALDAAMQIQRAVASRQATGPKLAVKISLAGGEPLFRGDRPYGLVLNRAFRVADTARPGQVVLDESVAATIDAHLIANRFTRDLRGIGKHLISVLAAQDGRFLSARTAVGDRTHVVE